MADRTLVVDLDGTLIRSDMLVESFWAACGQHWSAPLQAVATGLRGRAAMKQRLGALGPVDAAGLPYNAAVLDYIARWRAAGGRTALVTAATQGLADRVGAHLGIFDEVHGSSATENLKGAAKAAFLTGRFGAGGFDYIGDAEVDLPVWAAAQKAIVVGASAAFLQRVKSLGGEVEAVAAPPHSPRAYLRALRPHQWLKNLLVFLPILAAHQMHAPSLARALLAFVAFSLIASSVYVVNDLVDLASDRAHPRKRQRPFASGAIPLTHGTAMAPALLLAGLAVALPLGPRFLAVMLEYYALTTAYSFYFKRRLVVDIIMLAGLYTLRIVAGGVATHIPLSVWLLAFSVFFFFALAAVKRQAELVDGVTTGRGKVAGRGYVPEDLPLVEMMATSSGFVSVLVMALYLSSPEVTKLYHHPTALWGICVVLLYWISRVVMLTHRGQMTDDPVVFATKDYVSLGCGLAIAACALSGALL